MKGVFKITHAEFIKIFKKPIVYIMAFVLALTATLTLIFYKPNVRTSQTIKVNADNAAGYYAAFHGSGDTSKTKFDEIYNTTEKKINLYKIIYDRNTELDSAYNDYISAFNSLQNYANPSKKSAELLITDCNTNLNRILTTFADVDKFNDFNCYKTLLQTTNVDGSLYYKTHYIDTNQSYNYLKFESDYNKLIEVTNAEEYINYITTNEINDLLKHFCNYGKNMFYTILQDMVKTIQTTQDKFIKSVKGESQTSETQTTSTNQIKKYSELSKKFKDTVDLIFTNDDLLIFTTKKANKEFTNNYDSLIVDIESGMENKVFTQVGKQNVAELLKKNNYPEKFNNYLKTLKFLDVDKPLIERFNKITEQVNKNRVLIENDVTKEKDSTETSKIATFMTSYKLLGTTYNNLVKQLTLKQLSAKVSVNDIRDGKTSLENISSFNSYENNQNISRNEYQINTTVYDNTTLQTFSFENTSGYKQSAFDCIYITLKICTILIVFFTIMMIAGLITSETENGTIKLLLIRPYNRSKILIGKMLATLFFSVIFLLLAVVISFTFGAIKFGMPALTNVLVTFNATSTFLINPVLLLLIFFVSCVLDIIFYLILSLTVAVLFRSYIGAITTSFLIYVGAVIVGAFLPSSIIYAYLPFTNTSLFRFFGGELLSNITNKASVFVATPVQSAQTIYSSLIITGVTSIVLLITALVTFNKRDF